MALITHYIDPVFHSSTRTEFHIQSDKRALLPTLRLVGLSVSAKTGAGAADPDARFIYNGGVNNIVKRITLYSDSQVLCDLREASRWLGFKNLNQSNEAQQEIASFTNGSNIGLKEYSNLLDLNVGNTDTANVNGKLELVNVLNFLAQSTLLPAVKNMRLVVEYNTVLSEVFKVGSEPHNFSVNRPALIYDEYVGKDKESLLSKAKQGVLFRGIEVERIDVVAAPANNTVQPTDTRLRAWDGKQLLRLVMMTDPRGTANALLQHNRSFPMYQEKINFTVNGRKLMQFDAVNSDNRKLATMDSWGVFNVINGCQYPKLRESSHYDPATVGKLVGNLSYANFDIYDNINELQFNYSRRRLDAVAAETGQALYIYFFGEVSRYCKYGADGKLVMGYVT